MLSLRFSGLYLPTPSRECWDYMYTSTTYGFHKGSGDVNSVVRLIWQVLSFTESFLQPDSKNFPIPLLPSSVQLIKKYTVQFSRVDVVSFAISSLYDFLRDYFIF